MHKLLNYEVVVLTTKAREGLEDGLNATNAYFFGVVRHEGVGRPGGEFQGVHECTANLLWWEHVDFGDEMHTR